MPARLGSPSTGRGQHARGGYPSAACRIQPRTCTAVRYFSQDAEQEPFGIVPPLENASFGAMFFGALAVNVFPGAPEEVNVTTVPLGIEKPAVFQIEKSEIVWLPF